MRWYWLKPYCLALNDTMPCLLAISHGHCRLCKCMSEFIFGLSYFAESTDDDWVKWLQRFLFELLKKTNQKLSTAKQILNMLPVGGNETIQNQRKASRVYRIPSYGHSGPFRVYTVHIKRNPTPLLRFLTYYWIKSLSETLSILQHWLKVTLLHNENKNNTKTKTAECMTMRRRMSMTRRNSYCSFNFLGSFPPWYLRERI